MAVLKNINASLNKLLTTRTQYGTIVETELYLTFGMNILF